MDTLHPTLSLLGTVAVCAFLYWFCQPALVKKPVEQMVRRGCNENE
jgi:hypothetical protein